MSYLVLSIARLYKDQFSHVSSITFMNHYKQSLIHLEFILVQDVQWIKLIFKNQLSQHYWLNYVEPMYITVLMMY